MRIHFAFGDFLQEYNTSVFRVQIPSAELLAHGHDTTISHFNFLDEQIPPLDAVIIERNLFDSVIFAEIRRLKSFGVKIIATWDDAYHLMPDTSPSKVHWNESNLHLFRRALKNCTLGITPSRLLCQDYERFCKMQYVPNFFDADLYTGLHKKPNDGQIGIVWGGNHTHLESVMHSGVLAALGLVAKRHKRVVVHCVTSNPQILRLFRDALPPGQFRGHGWMPLEKWPSFVAEHADIGIAPLYGEYDRRRSWIKAVDFGMLGIPLVATNYEPYQDLPVLLVKNSVDEWHVALRDLVMNPDWRDTVGQNLNEAIVNLSIQKNWRVYEDVCRRD
jgi:hypothetical protein